MVHEVEFNVELWADSQEEVGAFMDRVRTFIKNDPLFKKGLDECPRRGFGTSLINKVGSLHRASHL